MTQVDSAKVKFIGLFATSVVLCVVIAAAFWSPLPSYPPQRTEINVSDQTNVSSTLAGEQNKTGSIPADSTVAHEQINAKLMSDAERSLTASMDSLRGTPGKDIQVSSTLALFREAIKNPGSISLISDALNSRNIPGAGGKEDIRKLKDDILAKEGQIVSLQNQLKTFQNTAAEQPEVSKLKKDLQDREAQVTALQNQLKAGSKNKETGDQQSLLKLKDDVQLKEAQIAKLMTQLKSRPNGVNTGNLLAENKKLMDENSFLKWAVRSEVSSNHNLTNLNSSLKQANANLLNQVNELKKN